MRRIFAILMSVTMLLSFIGCGTKTSQEIEQPTVTEESASKTEIVEENEEVTESVTESVVDTKDMPPLEAMFAEADKRRETILNTPTEITVTGKSYYVSNSGNDSNDGLSPETAWATVDKVNNTMFYSGDAVFFKRGDVFREYVLNCQMGVTYSAYGEGAKPIITCSPENGADPKKWTQYGETSDGGTIWVYYRDMRDCGTLVLDGKTGAHKVAPYWNGSSFITKEGEPFDMAKGLRWDCSFFVPADSLLGGKIDNDWSIGGWKVGTPYFYAEFMESNGPLYFRCDAGNPGEVFDSIEFSQRPLDERFAGVYMNSGSVLDNIHVFASYNCGIQHEDVIDEPFTVQNCEVSFSGGCTLFYDENGRPEVCGDGMAISKPARIVNTYIHHNGDNGITSEYVTGFKQFIASDVKVVGNLFEYNDYDIQITTFEADMKANGCVFRDYLIQDNYFLNASNGWSNYHHTDSFDTDFRPKVIINLGDFHTPLYTENVVFRNNVLYSDNVQAYISVSIGSYEEKSFFEDNTLYMKPYSMVTKENVGAIMTFGIDFPDDEKPTEILFITNEVVHPRPSPFNSWEDVLNDYLGSGNKIEFIDATVAENTEMEKAQSLGFIPEEIQFADSETITFQQMCTMIGNMLSLIDVETATRWKDEIAVTTLANTNKMLRCEGAEALFLAAKLIGQADITDDRERICWTRHDEAGSNYWSGCNSDSILKIFPTASEPTTFDGQPKDNSWWPAMLWVMGKMSPVSLKTILDYDEIVKSPLFGDSLTCEDAICAVLRLYETAAEN